MVIEETREIARVDVNDAYGVTLWQRRKQLELTSEEARAYAKDILAKADEADRYQAELKEQLAVVPTEPGAGLARGVQW